MKTQLRYIVVLSAMIALLCASARGATITFCHVRSDLVVTIAGLTITNGTASGDFPAGSGGGIYNDGYGHNSGSLSQNQNNHHRKQAT